MNGNDDCARLVTAKLHGMPIRVELAESRPVDGMQSVKLADLDLNSALDVVGNVGSVLIEKLRAAKPTKATVELRFGFAVEAGKLTALWVGGKGEASLTVTLEWSKDSRDDGSGDEADNDGGFVG